MSDYRSKLASRSSAPLRGVGSGIAANQAISGSAAPLSDAALAALPPDEARKIMESEQKVQADAYRKLEELTAAIEAGTWSPDGADAEDVKACQDIGKINGWHAELVAWRSSEEDEREEGYIQSSGISADNPLYDPMMDDARRKHYASVVEELDFNNLIFKGYADQVIPVRPGLDIVFRTMSTQHALWLEMMLSDVRGENAQYGRHWVGLLYAATSLVFINDVELTPDLSKLDRAEHHKAFRKGVRERMDRLMKMPEGLTNEIIVQYQWFSGRVRKLLQGDLVGKVGN